VAYRRYKRRNRSRVLISLGALAAVLLAVVLWPGGEDDEPTPLTGTLSPDRQQPALQRTVSPAADDSRAPARILEYAHAEKKETASADPVDSPSSQPAATRPAPSSGRAASDFQAGMAALQRDDLLIARETLNRALRGGLPPDQAKAARTELARLADKTVFTREVLQNDPLAEHYSVRPGDTLNKIARRCHVSEDLLAEINRIRDKDFIRVGMRIKLIQGPFHASIDRSDHEMHIFLQDLYVRTYGVALGANGNTPTGKWKVTDHLRNPSWTDPRTGQRWHADDPQNPLGEYWIKLEGIEGDAIGAFGYGIHGTIEPETIGQNVSMGCIRLAPKDIAEVFRMLEPGQSLVTITD
jgi:LysM repeat protein